MPEPRELRSVVQAAEQAAATGDYASAEQLLREAAVVQEARLGPLHPDLANTLNNLGVVCEITNKPADAEFYYRRAYSIATAVLQPDHPFVATSRKNLGDFCEARGRTVEPPTPARVVAAEREPPASSSGDDARKRPSNHEWRLFSFAVPPRLLAIGAIGVGGFVLVMSLAIRARFGFDHRSQTSTGSPIQPVLESPAPAVERVPVERVPAGPTSPPGESATRRGAPVAGRDHQGAAVPALAPPKVAEARLCSDLSPAGSGGVTDDWRCERASRPVKSGSLFFFTRVKSDGDTTVQHRWYRGGQLLKLVKLRIRANSTSGFRTYSRNTVDNLGGGDWRVELRTQDGILLHEESFRVR